MYIVNLQTLNPCYIRHISSGHLHAMFCTLGASDNISSTGHLHTMTLLYCTLVANRFQVVRFFKWAKGDGLLLDMYPQFTYRTLPNVNELTLLWVLLIALICCNSHSQTILPLKPALATLIWIWVVDIVADLYSLLIGPDCSSYPHITGFKTRFTGALASTILKAAVEFGHLWIQVWRLKIHNLCKRFDWFVNLSPNEKRKQQIRSCIRFTGYIMPILAHLFTLIVIDNTSHSDL